MESETANMPMQEIMIMNVNVVFHVWVASLQQDSDRHILFRPFGLPFINKP